MEQIKLDNNTKIEEIARSEEIRAQVEKEAHYDDILSDEAAIEKATKMLSDLGLTFDDLKDKKVVDLGSFSQIIERAAGLKSVGTVFSVDKKDYVLSKRPEVKNGIVADIRKGIPQIEDNSIDLLISRAGPPTVSAVSRKKEDVDFSINEILRMLRDGGEARIGPLWFFFIIEKNKRYKELRQKNQKDLTESEKSEKIRLENLIAEESLKYLKEKGLNIVMRKNEKMGWSYGIIKK